MSDLKPFLSVIVPIYKVERYLAPCIESIVNSELDDIEIILVNDGSPDNCPQICDEYSTEYKNVTTIHKENGGLVSARKAGIAAAKGKYITFVDGDDYIEPNYYRKAFESIEQKPDILILAIKKELNSNKIVEWKSEFPSGLYEDRKDIDAIARGVLFDERLKFKTLHSVCSMIVKADIYRKIVDYVDDSLSIYEDAIFSLNCIANAGSVFIQNENLGYFYRNIIDSMTNSKKKDLFPARIIYSNNLLKLKTIYPCILTEKIIKDDLSRCGIKQMMEYYSDMSFLSRVIGNNRMKRLFYGNNFISEAIRQCNLSELKITKKRKLILIYYRGIYKIVTMYN